MVHKSRRALRTILLSVLLGTSALSLCGLLVFHTDALLSELDVGPLGTEADVDVWMERVEAAHGARARWLQQGEVELTTRGSLPFVPVRAMFGLPVTTSEVDLTLTFRPDTHGPYRYAIRHGDQLLSGTSDTRTDRDGLGLMLDSVRHLFEVPWTAPTVPFRRGLGAAPGLEGIFVTWGSDPRPTRSWDQVALWSRGGTVVRMDTTGRDIAPFILARVDFDGAVELGALRLPRTATISRADGEEVVHAWELVAARSLRAPVN